MLVMLMLVMLTLTLLDAITVVEIRSLLRIRAKDDPRPLLNSCEHSAFPRKCQHCVVFGCDDNKLIHFQRPLDFGEFCEL